MASYWVYLPSEVSANRVVIVLSGIVICDDADLALAPDVGHGDGAPVLPSAAVSGQGARPAVLTIGGAGPVPGEPGEPGPVLAVIGALGAGGD